MHLIVVAAGVLLALWLLSRLGASRAPDFSRPQVAGAAPADPATPPSRAGRPIAFVSRGKLFHCAPGEPAREVHSPHVQAVTDRLERSRELHAWKEGTAFSSRFSGRGRHPQGDELPLQISAALFSAPGKLLYFLRDQHMGGLFEQDIESGRETRLIHRQNLLLDDLRLSPDGKSLLCSQRSKNGGANVARIDADGGNYRELTGGDTLDTAPCWVPGKPAQVVLQSAGLARDPRGFVIAWGPTSLQLLDTERQALTPIVDDPRFDHLQPRVAPDGSLLYIRRPYDAQRYGASAALLDALAFPFRLLRALVHYLNFFSLMYTQKPLTSASGPRVDADVKDLMIQGKRIDAEAALRRGRPVNGVPSLVPATWQLIRRSERGEETVLASHVASFDVAPDGSVYYSNGYGVFAIDGAGGATVVLRDRIVAEFALG